MNPMREESLFDLVTEKPAGERASPINLVCGDDEALRRRLDARLAEDEQSSGSLANQETDEAAPT